MYRDIILRGYSTEVMEGSQWVEGFGVMRSEFTEDYAKEIGRDADYILFSEHGEYEVYPESIGQYINKVDAEGNRLFEGDYFIGGDGDLAVITFNDNNKPQLTWYGFSDVMSESGWNESGGNFELQVQDDLEYYEFGKWTRKGNVFEDKDVLKGIY